MRRDECAHDSAKPYTTSASGREEDIRPGRTLRRGHVAIAVNFTRIHSRSTAAHQRSTAA